MKQSRTDILPAALTSAALLIAEHYAFQRGDRSLQPPMTYVIGICAVGVPFTWWAQRNDAMPAVEAFWALFGIGGAAVAAAYMLDEPGDN